MKKLIFVLITFVYWPGAAFKTQNDFARAHMDSLQIVLSHQKTAKDSLRVLQQLVDFTPVRSDETSGYPDHIKLLLELN